MGLIDGVAPGKAFIEKCTLEGARRTWPKLPLIEARCAVEQALDVCVRKLQRQVCACSAALLCCGLLCRPSMLFAPVFGSLESPSLPLSLDLPLALCVSPSPSRCVCLSLSLSLSLSVSLPPSCVVCDVAC